MTDDEPPEQPPRTVVAADDVPENVRILETFFERRGYEVRTASNGEEALRHIAAELPDLIVCDLMMPFMDGFEVLRELKAGELTRTIPVILMAAKNADGTIFRGWAGQFHYDRVREEFHNVYYVPKPLRETDLEQALGEIYSRFPGVKGT